MSTPRKTAAKKAAKKVSKKAAKKTATKKVINKGGRPKAQVDPRLVEQLASIGCTLQEMAAACNCHKDTLTGRFSAEIAKGRENGKTRLRKKQIEVALSGNVSMLIFLGKNMLGQSDAIRNEHTGKDGGPIRQESDFKVTPEDEAVIAKIRDKREEIKKAEK